MKEFIYDTKGTCANRLFFTIDEDHNTIESFKAERGCHGNLQGIGALLAKRDIDEVIHVLKGIRCGTKNTSCPDQIACALEAYQKEQGKH